MTLTAYDKHLDDQGTYYKRISDIFTKGKNPFIVISMLSQKENEAGKVLIINKKDRLVVPED